MTTVKEAAKVLLSVCDGARSKDFAGYTGVDSQFVRSVLSRNYFTHNQEVAIHKILLKYKKQLLNSFGIDYDKLTTETQPTQALPPVVKVKKPIVQIKSDIGVTIPFGKYKGMDLAKIYMNDPGYVRWIAHDFDDGYIKDCAIKLINGHSIDKPTLSLTLKNGIVKIKSPFEYKDRIKELPERKWNPDEKVWECPVSVLRAIVSAFPESKLSPEIRAELDKASSIAKLSDKASDKSIDIKFGELQLLPFQSVGVKFVENAGGRALIADEMGLGKTIQALAYLRLHSEIRPALIVCPASLKLNWRNEATKWLEASDKISVVSDHFESDKSIYIINYDILMKHKVEIVNKRFKIIILDESHYIKNSKAKRTKAIVEIATDVPYKLLLTGTPILNRPKELFTQLNVIDPIAYAEFTTFAFRYCNPQKNEYGWIFDGASHIEELNDRLKTTMVRRTKEQVLKELPDKRRQTIVVPLANRVEYNKAHNDFTKWLKETQGKTTDAEHLVRIEMLKQLSVNGKMSAIVEHIYNFLESDKKLVIFAHHKFVVDQLMSEFKEVAVCLTGDTTMEDRQKAVDDFQHKANIRLFIGNIQAAGVGITLTAAYDVMFIELPWTPSQLLQAEDRVHRIGQKNAVNVMYMTGEETIDIDIAELIQKKASVIDAVIDGKKVSDLNIMKELITKYSN